MKCFFANPDCNPLYVFSVFSFSFFFFSSADQEFNQDISKLFKRLTTGSGADRHVLKTKDVIKKEVTILLTKIKNAFIFDDVDFIQQHKLIKKFINTVFLSGCSVLLQLNSEIAWLLMEIMYEILRKSSPLEPEEFSDCIMRLVYWDCKIMNKKLPFKPSAREKAISKRTQSNKDCGESDVGKLLQILEKGRLKGKPFQKRKQTTVFDYFLFQFCPQYSQALLCTDIASVLN